MRYGVGHRTCNISTCLLRAKWIGMRKVMILAKSVDCQQRKERDCSKRDEASSLFSSRDCWVWHRGWPRMRRKERPHLLGHSARSSDKDQTVVQETIKQRLGVYHQSRDQRSHCQTLLRERNYDG